MKRERLRANSASSYFEAVAVVRSIKGPSRSHPAGRCIKIIEFSFCNFLVTSFAIRSTEYCTNQCLQGKGMSKGRLCTLFLDIHSMTKNAYFVFLYHILKFCPIVSCYPVFLKLEIMSCENVLKFLSSRWLPQVGTYFL